MPTPDELADRFKADFDDLHAMIEAEPEGQIKRKANRLARVAHGALDALKDLAVDDDRIQPFSGGEPKEG